MKRSLCGNVAHEPRPRRLVLSGLVVACVTRAALAGVAAQDRDWIEFRSPHYTVVSSVAAGRTTDIVKRLERYDQTLGKIFSRITFEPATERFLYVFDSDAAMTPFKPRFEGRPVDILGMYISTPDADYMMINAGVRADPLPIIYHEKMHEFEQQFLPRIPLWFREGLAECYETFRTDGKTAEIGGVQVGHVHFLRAGAFMPLADLFAVDFSSPDYNEGDRRNIFYAESWALVHYLTWDKPERRPQMDRYLDGMARGMAPPEAFAAAFDVSVEELGLELKRQIGSSVFHKTEFHFENELTFDTTAKVTPLEPGAAAARLADLMAHLEPDHGEDAEKLAQTSLAANPGNALASRALGLLRERDGKTADARRLYEAALAGNPKDPVTAVHLAAALLGETPDAPGTDPTSPTPDDIERARKVLVAAVKARPEFAEAEISYARCLLNHPDGVQAADRDFAIAGLLRARTRLPYRADAADNLALLYAINGDFENADDILERVLPGIGNPQATASVRDSVNRLRHEAEREAARTAPPEPAQIGSPEPGPNVKEPAATGKPAGAAADSGTYGPLPPLPGDPEARSLAQAIARSNHYYNDEVLLFNRCAALGNARNYRDAIRSLERLVAVTGNQDMKDQAESLLATMKKDAQRLHAPVD